ncbi:ABC transporter ATP-binding protein [Natronoglycomyces albus]|uniref:ABC transporter ATP-binding protein n=1 Tax=Natronoglycomyces albus TaxID=2811108 RepID=A0A895XJJ1_9ACTN|nr:ABC transporter ATP-binding protein [Natronoglycomyces albus]QSB03982.1 ABC transporter ATP-binding protein [Natronoglycomyces albus]
MELEVVDVVASFPGVPAVRGVSLEVPEGSIVAIVGPNGCGKSTLLKTIARLHKPDSGRILMRGDDVWSLKPREVAHRIALLPQSPLAPEAITVRHLISFGRHPHQGLLRQWSQSDDEAVYRAMVDTGVVALADRPLETLSGGQRQRCWLAMSLAQETPLLALDEPTSALDLGHAVEVLELIRAAADHGRTAIMVLHDLVAAARYADIVVAMKEGLVVAKGSPSAVVTTDLVRELYEVESDVVLAPSDGVPVVIPK